MWAFKGQVAMKKKITRKENTLSIVMGEREKEGRLTLQEIQYWVTN